MRAVDWFSLGINTNMNMSAQKTRHPHFCSMLSFIAVCRGTRNQIQLFVFVVLALMPIYFSVISIDKFARSAYELMLMSALNLIECDFCQLFSITYLQTSNLK